MYQWEDKISSTSNTSGKINGIIKNHDKHPSICNIKTKYRGIRKFSFRPVSVKEVKKIILDLNTNKSVVGEIPTKILNECEFTFNVQINKLILCIFPDSLKLANVALFLKKKIFLRNDQPVSILPFLSKVYEKVIYNKFSDYSDSFMNNKLCGFRKINSTEHVLFKLLPLWQQVLDNVGFISTIVIWFLIPVISYTIIYCS